MKVIISGICGYMGRVLTEYINKENDLELVAGVDINADKCNCNVIKCFTKFSDIDVDFDVIVDFSNHLATKDLINCALEKNISLVIATTGQTEEELEMIKNASKKIPIFFAANYSIGIAVLIKLAKQVAMIMKNADIEILETHHNRKLDAPSGTALAIGNALKEVRTDAELICGRSGKNKREKNQIGINSIRLSNIVGIHEVLISTENECITLKHEAFDRALFAEGAVNAIKFIKNKAPNLYNMNDLVKFD